MARKKKIEDSFWGKVEVIPFHDCWEWVGSKNKAGWLGYGRLGGGLTPSMYAHRVSYEIHYGSIARGMQVLHKCDNPGCVNPRHLFLGTITDNMIDKVKKGRHLRKVDLRTIDDINEKYKTGKWTQEQLAREYGVDQTSISIYVNNKTKRYDE